MVSLRGERPGAYDEDERNIWQALAQYEAGFDPSSHAHPADDAPPSSVRAALGASALQARQQTIDNLTAGFWAGNAAADASLPQTFRDWPVEKQAAFLICRGGSPAPADSPRLREWAQKIAGVWERWRAMTGPNPPLARCVAGPRRDFDINLDGMAHYGLLPDLLQDVRNVRADPG